MLPNVCRVIMITLIICVDAIIGCTIIKIMEDLKYKNSFVDKAVLLKLVIEKSWYFLLSFWS